MNSDYEQSGIPHDRAGVRIDRMEEGIAVLKGLFADGAYSFEGEHYRITGMDGQPKPVQRPHPPIAIGGNGERRTLRTVARWAQHWNSVSQDPAEWLRKREVLHAHCADIGRDPAEIETSVLLRLSGDDDPQALQPLAQAWTEAGADICIVYLAPPHTAAAVGRIADALAPFA